MCFYGERYVLLYFVDVSTGIRRELCALVIIIIMNPRYVVFLMHRRANIEKVIM